VSRFEHANKIIKRLQKRYRRKGFDRFIRAKRREGTTKPRTEGRRMSAEVVLNE
jgi:hypothetical protein